MSKSKLLLLSEYLELDLMRGERSRRRGFQPEAAGSETQGHPVTGEPGSPWVAVPEDSAAVLACGAAWRLQPAWSQSCRSPALGVRS